jgi:hypothetical protein
MDELFRTQIVLCQSEQTLGNAVTFFEKYRKKLQVLPLNEDVREDFEKAESFLMSHSPYKDEVDDDVYNEYYDWWVRYLEVACVYSNFKVYTLEDRDSIQHDWNCLYLVSEIELSQI